MIIEILRGDYDIYAQCFSSNGISLGNNFKLNNLKSRPIRIWGSYPSSSPSIASDDNGNTVISWRGVSEIYAQRVSKEGTLLDSIFKVNDDNKYGFNPAVSINQNGDFIIVWRSMVYTHNIIQEMG